MNGRARLSPVAGPDGRAWRERLAVVAITSGSHEGYGEGYLGRCEAVLAGGATALMLREKALGARELYNLATRLLPLARRHRALFIVNGRIDVALACGADGAQLGHDALPIGPARRIVPPGFLIGSSCHNARELAAAGLAGADFALLSPVFEPNSKAATGPPLGIAGFRDLVQPCPIPVVALGGITPETARACREAGAAGVAAIGGLFAAKDPAAAARALRAASM